MNNRILDISDTAIRLSVSDGALLLEPEDQKPVRVAFSDMAIVIASHPHGRYTHAALAGLAEAGAIFVACDGKHLPVGMMIPLQGNFVQGERFVRQADVSVPIRKRAWQAIVRAKIIAQAQLLVRLGRPEPGLLELAKQVRSGDPENIEAQAARRYWPLVFPDGDFLRNREAGDMNRHLNYGYAVLRAITARAICGAGLHPGLGLHHHNRYDAFPLADDLMEPFRPIVDEVVAAIRDSDGPEAPMEKEQKGQILRHLSSPFEADGESRTLFDWISQVASSLVKVNAQEIEEIEIPDIVGRSK